MEKTMKIILKENVYYKKFSDEICNGKVYTMFGDEKVYIGYLKDGKQDGLWSEWLENGQKRKETTYKEGDILDLEMLQKGWE